MSTNSSHFVAHSCVGFRVYEGKGNWKGKGKGYEKPSKQPTVTSPPTGPPTTPSPTAPTTTPPTASPSVSVAPTACLLGICNAIDFSITWDTTQDGVAETDGGWRIDNDGRSVRFAIEDSVDCGGPNDEIQSGTAVATIVVPEDYLLTLNIEGMAEQVDSGFELMSVYLDDALVVTATSAGRDDGNYYDNNCEMVPAVVTFLRDVPFVLAEGEHTFRIDFTTNDALWHQNAFYEFQLVFQPVG